ncbi:MAG TPA: hypothetical protein VFA23_16500 [Dongiaceae bacterium]|nr:hypothetical protein [Dongiaceae bacterium]
MTGPAFLDAVLDLLLPVERDPPPGATPMPGGREIGIDLGRYAEAGPVLESLRQAFGGEAAFMTAAREAQLAALAAVEQAAPEAWRQLIDRLLPDYFESPAVLAACGWRSAPPQPLGHPLAAAEEETLAALERVRRRGRMWRD